MLLTVATLSHRTVKKHYHVGQFLLYTNISYDIL